MTRKTFTSIEEIKNDPELLRSYVDNLREEYVHLFTEWAALKAENTKLREHTAEIMRWEQSRCEAAGEETTLFRMCREVLAAVDSPAPQNDPSGESK